MENSLSGNYSFTNNVLLLKRLLYFSHTVCFCILENYHTYPSGSVGRGSAVARLLGLWFRFPPRDCKSVFCEYCLLSGWGLCDGLIFVQRTPTECGVSSGSDREARRGRPWPGIGWSATKRRYIANSSHVRMFIFVGVLYEVITWNALCRDHFRLSVHVSVCPSVTYQRLYRLWNFHGRAFILSIISLTQRAGRCLSVFRVVLTPVSRRYHELNAKVIHLTQCVLHCGLHKYTVNWEMFRTDRSIVNTEDVKEERKEWWRWEGQIKGIGKRSTNIYIKWSDMLNY